MDFSKKLVKDYLENANKTLAFVCRCIALLMTLIGVLNYLGVFVIEGKWMYVVISLSIIIALLPTFVFNVLDKTDALARYIVLSSLVLMCCVMYSVLSYHAVIMLVFPIACSCLYSERKYVVFTMGISIPLIIIAHLVALQLHVVPDEPLVTLYGTIVYGILPRIIQFIAISIICIGITDKIKKLIQTLIDKNNELFDNQRILIRSLSELIEAQSQETGQHVKRVSEYTRIICEGLGYNKELTWEVSIASMMHDIGKIMVPIDLIEKPDSLTKEEYEQVMKHVDYGKKILEQSPGEMMQISANIAYQHHERYDGSGYKHLSGEDINIYARIVSLADVFDALTSKRAYKNPWSLEEVYEEIVNQSGKQFDPVIVDVFKENFSKFKEVIDEYPDAVEVNVKDIIKEKTF